MEPLKHTGAEEQPASEVSYEDGIAAALRPLIGTWVNTNGATRGIEKVDLTARENKLIMRVFGVCDPSPCDWGEITAQLFTKEICYHEAMAFIAAYDFGFMETELLAHVKLGVLVIAKFDRFKDDSGRSNYFSREFFYRSEAGRS
jgi:hypothetical protein